jgi:hypothetical protein
LVAFGDTALYQAVADAATQVAAASSARKFVVLLSDGADFGGHSRASRESSLAMARDSGAPFYIVGIGSQTDSGYLADLASQTRGQVLNVSNPADLPGLVAGIGEQARLRYRLTLDAGGAKLYGAVSAQVMVSAAGATGSASVRFTSPVSPPVVAIPEEVAPVAATATESPAATKLLPFAGAGLAAVALATYVARKRWRRRAPAALPVYIPDETGPALVIRPRNGGERSAGPSRAEPTGRLVLVNGQVIEVGHQVVTLSVDRTGLADAVSQGAPGAALRLWRSNRRFVVRDISRNGRLRVNGHGTKLAMLNDGDELSFGQMSARFLAAAAAPGAAPGTHPMSEMLSTQPVPAISLE